MEKSSEYILRGDTYTDTYMHKYIHICIYYIRLMVICTYIYVKQQYDSRLMGLFIPICLMDYFEGYPT